MKLTNKDLIDQTGIEYDIILWDHKSLINGTSLKTFYNAYPFAEDKNADVILLLLNNNYTMVQRVENPNILINKYSLPSSASIDDIMDRYREEIYNDKIK